MSKSPDAFRTISEVADWLGIQAHVLRFWESKFTQVKPIKRAGGRRYYRPADMLLLGGIKKLLHDDGLTIKGVQKLLREEGMSHVAAMSTPLEDGDTDIEIPVATPPTPKLMPEPEEKSVVLPFEAPKDSSEDTLQSEPFVEAKAEETPEPESQAAAETQEPSKEPVGHLDEPKTLAESDPASASEQDAKPAQQSVETPKEELIAEPAEDVASKEVAAQDATPKEEVSASAPAVEVAEATDETSETEEDAQADDIELAHTDAIPNEPVIAEEKTDQPKPSNPPAVEQAESPAMPVQTKAEPPVSEIVKEPSETEIEAADDAVVKEESTAEEPSKALPSFLRGSAPTETSPKEPEQAPVESAEPDADEPIVAQSSNEEATTGAEALQEPDPSQEPPEEIAAESAAEPEVNSEPEAEPTPPAPRARDIGMPQLTPEHEIHADQAMLSGAYRTRAMDAQTAQKAQPLLEQLTALRDRMASQRGGARPKS
jgi:DNA-binding transcriptional MerR regulator